MKPNHYFGYCEVCQKWEELQDPRQEVVVRLDVVGGEGHKVKVCQCVLGQLERLVEKLRMEDNATARKLNQQT